jgi:hypothetical protein
MTKKSLKALKSAPEEEESVDPWPLLLALRLSLFYDGQTWKKHRIFHLFISFFPFSTDTHSVIFFKMEIFHNI